MKEAHENLLATTSPRIRTVAQVSGLVKSGFQRALYGSLRNRVLEIDKRQPLVTCNGNFDKTMSLSLESKTDLKWWVDTLPLAFNLINYGDPQAMMTTDAFFTVWVCWFDTVATEGNWTPAKAVHDITTKRCLLPFLH